MAEPKSRRGLLKRILPLCGLLAFLVTGLVLLLRSRPDPMPPASLVLPDGSKIFLAGVTCGTNHVIGTALGAVNARMPDFVQNVLRRLFSSRALAHQAFTTTMPTLVFWLNSPKASTSPPTLSPGYYEAFLADSNGFVSGTGMGFNPGMVGIVTPLGLQFGVFPRRDRTLALHFYYHDPQGKVKECGALKLLNPGYHSYPQWQPELLPETKRAGDVEATLVQVGTGLEGVGVTRPGLAGRDYAIEFGTNRYGGRNETACLLRLRSLADGSQVWQVDHVELSDATGNLIKSGNMSSWSAGDVFEFSPGLWTSEAAWKMRVEIRRNQGFAPVELFTFRNVPLGEVDQTNHFGWSTNVNGVTVILDHLIRRPPPTGNGWSSSQLSEASFRLTGLINDLHVDLVETRTDAGTKVECVGWNTSDDLQTRSFRDVPTGAKTLDFTFAVHEGRWVEFVVKPETGRTRFEYPAPPKP